jgi:hypothetical protein
MKRATRLLREGRSATTKFADFGVYCRPEDIEVLILMIQEILAE